MQSLKILVDNRERNMLMHEELSNLGVAIDFAQLPVGDYIISDRTCIERKTVPDFEKSIIDNRLFDQSKRLSSSFGKPILLIEGDEADFRLSENVILGTILKLYYDFNIQVIRSRDPVQTAGILAKVAEREQTDEKREPRLVGEKRAFSEYEQRIMLLSMLPGVGPMLAKRLIGHFGSIRGVITASEEELCEVDKIGKKKAAKLYSLINGSIKG
jgi:Fanconi anemia group M protein